MVMLSFFFFVLDIWRRRFSLVILFSASLNNANIIHIKINLHIYIHIKIKGNKDIIPNVLKIYMLNFKYNKKDIYKVIKIEGYNEDMMK